MLEQKTFIIENQGNDLLSQRNELTLSVDTKTNLS